MYVHVQGVRWLCTQTTSGHAHFGIFFEVKAKDTDVFITGTHRYTYICISYVYLSINVCARALESLFRSEGDL